MPEPEFTFEQVTSGVFSAIRKGRPDIAESLLRYAAVHYPRETTEWINTVKVLFKLDAHGYLRIPEEAGDA